MVGRWNSFFRPLRIVIYFQCAISCDYEISCDYALSVVIMKSVVMMKSVVIMKSIVIMKSCDLMAKFSFLKKRRSAQKIFSLSPMTSFENFAISELQNFQSLSWGNLISSHIIYILNFLYMYFSIH